MLATPFSIGVVSAMFATQFCVTDWTVRRVLELPSRRPLRAAATTLLLSALTVGPAVLGIDTLVGGDLSALTRILLLLAVGIAQTGLVLRLVYRSSIPLAFAEGLVLQLTWGAVGVLVILCSRLGGYYFAAPIALILTVYLVNRTRDRDLERRLSSVPPCAPAAPPPGSAAPAL